MAFTHSSILRIALSLSVILFVARVGHAQGPADPPPPPTWPTAPAAAQPAESKKPALTAEQIAAWIAQLDDRRYLVRERATQQLLAARGAALDLLVAAANSPLPEPADRALWVLQRFAESEDLSFRRAALERLAQLADRPQVAAAANEALAKLRHIEARLAIKRLGGRFMADEPFEIDPRMLNIPLILDEVWKGKPEDLALLNEVIGLRRVVIIGTDLTAAHLQRLQEVPMLEDLWLYGTRLNDSDVAELRAVLPQATIDYRRGGLLGIRGQVVANDGVARVESVEPGSAAANAGIQQGDVIRRFNGEDVGDFKSLTEKIAKFRPGDEVSLEVVRGGATKKYTLQLGQWTAEQLLNRQ
jgi:hypothetical protein